MLKIERTDEPKEVEFVEKYELDEVDSRLSESIDEISGTINKKDNIPLTLIHGYYISSENGQLVSNDSSYYSNVNVTDGDIYDLSTISNNNVRSVYAFYDIYGSLISTLPSGTNTEIETYRIIIPTNCTMMRVCCNGANAPQNIKLLRLGNLQELYRIVAESKMGYVEIFGNGCERVDGYTVKNNIHIPVYAKVKTDGILTKVRCYVSTDGQIDVYRFKRNGSTTWYENLGFVCSAPVKSGYNEIDCYCEVKQGEIIGLYDNNSTTIGYYTNTADNYIKISGAGSKVSQGSPINASLCVAFEVSHYGTNEIHNTVRKNGGILIDTSTVSDEALTSTGWNSDFSTATNNAYIYFNKPSGMDEYVGVVKLSLITKDTKIALCQFDNFGYYVSLDFNSGNVAIHHGWDGLPNGLNGENYILAQLNISDTELSFTTGREYIIEVEQDSVKQLTVTIIDSITMKKASLSHICVKDSNNADYNNHGKGRHPFGLILKRGGITVKQFKIYTKMPTTPTLMIYGDSFSEGFNLIRYGFECEKRYPELIRQAFNGKVAISAKGGESTTGLVEKIDTDFKLFKPKYTLIAMSVNDAIVSNNSLLQFKTNMSKLIEACRKNGSEPILQTMPSLGNGATLIRQYNSWVKNYNTGIRYLDINAVTRVESSDTPDINNYFLEDGHPNVLGNQRIFDRFMLDFSDLFADNN